MSSGPLKIAVVEDERRLRELLLREIRAMGFAASGFRSAEEAWPALEGGDYDATLLDLNLPGENGMDLFQRIHARHPGLAVVVLTGFGALPSAIQALRWGATDYLTKPCSLADIEAALARIDARRREAAIRLPDAPAEAPPDEPPEPPPAAGATRTLEELERTQILASLREHQGNKPAVAEALGISLRTLYNKLNSYRAQGFLE